jgi:hypothetical protein
MPWAFAPPLAHRVAGHRVFDLDDLGTEVTEQLAAEWSGQQRSQLDDPEIV